MQASSRGFTLAIVLFALAIIMMLIIALLASVSEGVRFAQVDAHLARETMLADSAAALVMGQLQQATSATNQAWISQPGLIRTFAATNAARTPVACYKLYSAPQMIDTSGSVSFMTNDVPVDWNSTENASVYTDLNVPAQTLSASSIYPILDAKAVTSVAGLSSDSGHAVEMPVAWLYELQDGTLGSQSAATAANPIVGRIAFWTDDETSKININTAGENSPWNTPRTDCAADKTNAIMQPVPGEYERYPGHPAGVSLGVLFGTNTATSSQLTGDQLLALTPRYSSGGTEFGTTAASGYSAISSKTDRLYGSVDELCFGTALSTCGQRLANPIAPADLNLNRFVLTAHSHAPETTMLGEPRVAIWPVYDTLSDSARVTAADRAVASDATMPANSGSVAYYFARHDATSSTNDLNQSIEPGNSALFLNLVAAGSEQLPGSSSTLAQKYPGAQWSQLVLEMLDSIRGFNAVDPAAGSLTAPTSFVPFAAGDGAGVGRGLVVPLTAALGTTPLRGIGRYPTLFNLTLVLYVSGFGFKDGTAIDYETSPDDLAGTNWKANFLPLMAPGSRWSQVNKEFVRAFIVPTTFQPNCGFPEVSDACSVQISGLDKLTATCGTSTGGFGFPAVCTSRLLSDALTVAPADRAWGGFEGPLAWRAAAIDAMNGNAPYALAGTQAFTVPLRVGAALDVAKTNGPSLPVSWAQTLSTAALNGITISILDRSGKTVQTYTLNLPAIATPGPTVNGEADHYDGSTPEASHSDWAANSAYTVAPSYYMTLKNRLLATQRSRELMIQAGDATYTLETHTDPRLIASLTSVPATFFGALTSTWKNSIAEGGTQLHDLRFADGTSACFVTPQVTALVSGASYANSTSSFTVIDWRDGTTKINYTYATSPPVSAPTGTTFVTIAAPGASSPVVGDWDAGPGFAPDGALANLPDAGTTFDPGTAYESIAGGQIGAATLRSPNALVPSPIVFGSLPAGVNPTTPAQSQAWRTLVFSPFPAGGANHPGLASPPDYSILDRFWMPVIEPYGISTRFETAGKINLNDQIAPFTYLHRNTALHALLRSVLLPAVPKTSTTAYKSASATPVPNIWKSIDENATIAQIESRFATGDAFLTEGEICSVPLIPADLGALTPQAYWTSSTGPGFMTGDNLRELPYAQLYSRLTTRSNSYTVHIRAQVLQKFNDYSNPAVWREGVDRVVGDWRGSYEIERYLDPNAMAPAPGQPLGPYKFRVLSAQRFTP